MSTISQQEWEAKGVELFGENKQEWRFVCPACGNVESLESAKKDHPDAIDDWRVEQECIGRHTTETGCNWAAYGLFWGPVLVELKDAGDEAEAEVTSNRHSLMPIFDFEGKPFTKEAA